MKPPRLAFLRRLTVTVGTLMLAGCAVGPDFKKPDAPTASGYATSLPPTTSGTPIAVGGESQRFFIGHDIPGEWWKLFHSQPLNELIEKSLRTNPDLQAAQAALLAARESTRAQKGAYLPAVSGSLAASRNKTSGDISPTPNSGALYFNLYTPQVSVSYAPDVFGLNQRTVESLNAQQEAVRYQLAATHIALSANVVVAAIGEASLRAQIDVTRQLIAINSNMVQVVRDQFAKGNASRTDVTSQEGQLAQVTATLPPLLKQLAQQKDLLAALSGRFPGQDSGEDFELSKLVLPTDIPVSLPSQLVEQRPDVRQAEENWHAASAQVGIAAANRLPNFMLTGDLGSMALNATHVLAGFAGGTGMWTLAGNVTEPIFDGGSLLHKERAAQAACVQAAAQYRSTVLASFQNVADTLNALDQDADALKSAAAAMQSAQVTLDLTRQQVETGQSSHLTLLNADQAYRQTLLGLIQAQTNRFEDTAALFLALGGGWWHRADVPQQ